MKTRSALVLVALIVGGGVPVAAQTPTGVGGFSVSVLASFGTMPDSPLFPVAPGFLAEGPGGDIYGTTPSGGKHGHGTIFKVALDGTTTVVHDFDGVLGNQPQSGLTRGADGNFYGTTYGGGDYKVGTIFSFSPQSGSVSVLYSFHNGWLPKLPRGKKYTAQQILDAAGSYPSSAPVQATDGNFYGVTTYANNQKYGVLYRIGAGGFHALYKFDGRHGNYPGMLAAGADGNLYGITYLGGKSGLGTVFRATPSGGITTLHEFDVVTGAGSASLISGTDGNLYGTTRAGGYTKNGGKGVVFKIALPSGEFSVLHKFDSVNGAAPFARMVEGPDGYLYGAARYGGARSGMLYRLRKDDGSDFYVVHKFVMYRTGHSPMGALLRHTNGDFFGTAYQGGVAGKGGIYRMHIIPCLHDPRPEPPKFEGGMLTQADEWVEVYTHVVGSQSGIYTGQTDDGITIRVKSADDPHVVQFIYRERIAADGKRYPGQVPMRFPHGTGSTAITTYLLTVDPQKPNWNTDSPAWPSPFQDSGKAWRVDCHSLTTFDQPGFGPSIFKPGHGETWRATVKAFVLVGGEPVRVVTWTREVVNDGFPSYIVQRPAAPTKAEIDFFKKLSAEQGFLPWP